MFHWIATAFPDQLKALGLDSAFNVFRYISFRASMAAVTAFLLCWLFGPSVIEWLRRRGMGERICSDSEFLNERHRTKSGTVTMGGVFIIGSIVISTLLWGDVGNYYVVLGLVTVVWLAVLGGVDDYVKNRTTRNGLNKKQKLLFQLGLGLILGFLLYDYHGQTEYGTKLVLPFVKSGQFDLGFFYIPLVCLVVTAASNAVNLTDGMDGLASGCTIIAGMAFIALAYLAGHSGLARYLFIPFMPGSGELAVICAAMVGSAMGFLWYNCEPASVFMGDTGSLPLGGLMGYVAVVIRQELLMLIVGGVFVMEILSVVLQVGSYKLRHGKRVFRIAPLHHHYQRCGWSDTQVVTRFWIMAGLLALFALATLKMR